MFKSNAKASKSCSKSARADCHGLVNHRSWHLGHNEVAEAELLIRAHVDIYAITEHSVHYTPSVANADQSRSARRIRTVAPGKPQPFI